MKYVYYFEVGRIHAPTMGPKFLLVSKSPLFSSIRFVIVSIVRYTTLLVISIGIIIIIITGRYSETVAYMLQP